MFTQKLKDQGRYLQSAWWACVWDSRADVFAEEEGESSWVALVKDVVDKLVRQSKKAKIVGLWGLQFSKKTEKAFYFLQKKTAF